MGFPLLKQIKFLYIQVILSLLISVPVSAVRIEYLYDSRNRLEKVLYQDGSVISYKYDNIGNRRSMTITNPDEDNDGMPDIWELKHFDSLERDGSGDHDGDGISDLDEYLRGSDPSDKGKTSLANTIPFDSGESGSRSTPVPGNTSGELDAQPESPSRTNDNSNTTLPSPPNGSNGIEFPSASPGANSGSDTAIENASHTDRNPKFNVVVASGYGTMLSGINVHAFTEMGDDTGLRSITDKSGTAAFELEIFDRGDYMFGADYLSSRFWSDMITIPDSRETRILIEEEETLVRISGAEKKGIKISLHNGDASNLGKHRFTDIEGIGSFRLPVGETFLFSVEISGKHYWSDPVTIMPGETNLARIPIETFSLNIAVKKAPEVPLAGVPARLYRESRIHTGKTGLTDHNGEVIFQVPEEDYRVEVERLGYRFPSDLLAVNGDTSYNLIIPHRDITLRIFGNHANDLLPLQGITLRLLNSKGTYAGVSKTSDDSGELKLTLTEMDYRAAVTFMGRQLFIKPLESDEDRIVINEGIAILNPSGFAAPLTDLTIHIHSEADHHMRLHGQANREGLFILRLPEGKYRFGLDHNGVRYWSAFRNITAHAVTNITFSLP